MTKNDVELRNKPAARVFELVGTVQGRTGSASMHPCDCDIACKGRARAPRRCAPILKMAQCGPMWSLR